MSFQKLKIIVYFLCTILEKPIWYNMVFGSFEMFLLD